MKSLKEVMTGLRRERDEKICRLYREGQERTPKVTHQQLAETFGITRERVSQIVASGKAPQE